MTSPTTVHYLTKSWRLVPLDFGPGMELGSPALPPVLWISTPRTAVTPPTMEPGYLVTPTLFATIAYRVDSANARDGYGSPEALARTNRFLTLADALRGLLAPAMAQCYDLYDRYSTEDGHPPLPSPPRMTILQGWCGCGVNWPVYTVWDDGWVE